ncbi:PREDICTED: piggyBac transposable element-derived protein 3-like [Cyphomyrmex costatus]|uniref:piggyBac transposable element-derived protein 3-like n=1 Tax=Cyphomyrmex costatus TaxID=456900 RepID=UPI0008521F67|nr:PREDICTED: piggyBac transposable element-derived protein 3-like [Cyphomyrmex costatus]
MWGICDANGYVYDFDVYCGKNSDKGLKLGKIAMGSRVVIQMLNQLLTHTSPRKLCLYHLYFDNLFCCPDLMVHLKNLGLRATGVVRSDRIREKNSIDKDAPKGTHAAKHDKNSGLNFITARDSKDVSILSTAAGVSPQMPMKR